MFGWNLSDTEWLIVVVFLGLSVVGWWKIFSRAGYPGLLGLFIFVPVVNFVAFLWLAFLPWPIEDKLREQALEHANQSE
jgi:hypothetical protein